MKEKNLLSLWCFQIDAVPTVIFFKSGSAFERVDGADVPKITSIVEELGRKSANHADEPIESRLKKLINRAPLMIFMKGDRETPRCGFSKQLIAIVNDVG